MARRALLEIGHQLGRGKAVGGDIIQPPDARLEASASTALLRVTLLSHMKVQYPARCF